jgi:hypothetical protein
MAHQARLRMGRLDDSDSFAGRHLDWHSDHMGYAFLLRLSFRDPPGRIRFNIARATRLTHQLASSISPTGPAAASNFNPDYVFTAADILYTKITFSTSVLYFFITSITKISILLLLYRLFYISDSFRIQIYIAVTAVVAFWFSATMADVLNCVPLEWTWNNGNADPRYCINFNTFWLGTGIAESVIDLYILVLPIAMVSTLHLERNRRYGVAGIFLMGGL